MTNLTVEDIKKAISGTDFEFYGLRVDDGIRYSVGDTANNSRQLFQDPDFDEDGELIYPYIEDGVNKGMYDAGELDGTCTISFDADDDATIVNAIEQLKNYSGNYIHILGGDCAEDGNDMYELIISDAEVLGAYDR
ncbi:MAG: hypothetical protein HFI82_13440 [Eubacterium sp.]|nr:hypothetical protein [Eubacterium sp.]